MSIEKLKEQAEQLYRDIEDFLTRADSDPALCDDDTHDELCDIQESISAFVGDEALDDDQ